MTKHLHPFRLVVGWLISFYPSKPPYKTSADLIIFLEVDDVTSLVYLLFDLSVVCIFIESFL